MTDLIMCQSCGMPLTDESRGTEADGSPSADYCSFCYQNGGFTQDLTMHEMMEINLRYIDQWNESIDTPMTVDEARAMLETVMPTWKRWQS